MNLQLKEYAYPHNPTKLGFTVAITQLASGMGFLVFVISMVFSQPNTEVQHVDTRVQESINSTGAYDYCVSHGHSYCSDLAK